MTVVNCPGPWQGKMHDLSESKALGTAGDQLEISWRSLESWRWHGPHDNIEEFWNSVIPNKG